MIQRLKTFLTDKGYRLVEKGDCYIITSPTGKQTVANLRWKTKPVWGRRNKRWEWSIPLRQWQRYIQGGVETFFVLEKSTGTIFCASKNDLQPVASEYPYDDLDVGGTMFLPTSAYKRIGTIAV